MWAVVGETETPIATGVLRQDVTDRFSPEKEVTSTCGFYGEVSTGPGENFIEIHAKFVDGSSAMLFKRLVVNLGFETTPKRQLDEDYLAWVECFDTVGIQDRQNMESAIERFEKQPLISVLLPVYNTEERWLCEVIESVKSQIYSNWELCIADDASPLPHVREILEKYEKSDERIKVVYREENGHISATTNSALDVATGEFCALLDHDDALPPHAFYYVVKEINEHPDADLIFSDEDKIDADGKRFDPYFKSDWNPDLFLSHNCISHLGVYKTSILREIEGFNEDLNGSQDWDMAFRFLLKTTPERIRHIPRVLYHWRYLDTSTSKSIESKPYAVDAGKKAIEQYLEARGVAAEVMQGMWSGAYRVKYGMSEQTKVSIIIPFRDQASVTERCVRSILEKTELRNFEILLVDNESEEQEAKEFIQSISAEEKVQVLPYPHPFNFAAINNFAAKRATGEVVLFLNNDVEVVEGNWLKELASQAMRDEIGAVGAWLLFPDHHVQHAGILMGVCGIAVEAFKHQLEWNIGHMGRAHLNQFYSAVTGACLATRREVFEKLGGFNEKDLAVAYNDVDFCLRAKRDLNLHTTWTPYAKLIHHESTSRGYEVSDTQKERFEKESSFMKKEWKEWIETDPYYNPNLTKYNPSFTLAWPPRWLGDETK
ncbi:MAG: glycosyltransferase [Opitutales bacterium]|nr:glycosyltransferase [Opitutales bacterium]